MRLSRLLSVTIVVGCAAAATVVACGGDDHAHPDSKVYMDAKVFMDAPPAGANAVGQACGGSAAACPTGYQCIQAGSAAPAWCTKPCVQGSGDTCAQNYTGTGFPACIFKVGSGAGMTVCGVICSETTAGTICPGGACTGMCPGALTCTAPLQTGSGMMVGSACK